MPELLQYFPQRVELAQYAQPNASRTLIRHQQATSITSKPEWHAPWKLMKVITGHQGWVRSIAIEPENKWFATGASDATIKIWDLASSRLKVTLAGHIMPVRGLVVSERHPYLFSASEDKTVKNWDLEKNKIVRDYYGHVSSVYALDLHPHLDVLASAGRDAVVRVWDVRSRTAIHVISGHTSSITNVKFQDADPQLVSTSMDGTIRLYDLVAGKTRQVLTHHKKAVRGLAIHPEEFTMATASSDDIKQWGFPEGDLLGSCYPNHTGIVNTIALNDSNVLFSGADDGSMAFFDWKTGHKFQDTATTAIPGSLESERGIFASSFDKSGLRLLTGETDKSVKVWREDPDATPETHPGNSWDYSMAVGEI
ncbi:hypothetical protein BABINDRAFT_40779 [Babjeviella inositovora NRRL Y-12698]|uniref:Pre-mRNA-splicing factor PRP46 n=1 Tax=Babjeviella inositovora NRRL Y-12698 TaxID=984486 RepID=A0A1E3QJV2_9ASCO|nr:uncharacterized protein BABINDRAFT_40779 [Babjeviella inositovora NRRL Y-12698]ODQ77754.1 hypothetical protein BABINDRAFT_40779 [Babjeviella inositovora NRRL Y-12698]